MIIRNPFIVALCAPVYQLIATIAITNDFLMAAIFIMFTLGLIGAYVTDFPLLSTLYMNEVAHKTSVSSLMGMLLGMMLFLAFGTGGDEGSDGGMISAGGKFMLTWGILTLPAGKVKMPQVSINFPPAEIMPPSLPSSPPVPNARNNIIPSNIPINDDTEVLWATSFIYSVDSKGKSVT